MYSDPRPEWTIGNYRSSKPALMSTIQSVVSWGEPLPDDGSIAFNYSGPERAAVTRGGPCGDHLPLSFPTPTESCDFSNFCYPQASYEHSYYSPDHSVTAFSSPVEVRNKHRRLSEVSHFTPWPCQPCLTCRSCRSRAVGPEAD